MQKEQKLLLRAAEVESRQKCQDRVARYYPPEPRHPPSPNDAEISFPPLSVSARCDDTLGRNTIIHSLSLSPVGSCDSNRQVKYRVDGDNINSSGRSVMSFADITRRSDSNATPVEAFPDIDSSIHKKTVLNGMRSSISEASPSPHQMSGWSTKGSSSSRLRFSSDQYGEEDVSPVEDDVVATKVCTNQIQIVREPTTSTSPEVESANTKKKKNKNSRRVFLLSNVMHRTSQ